MIYFVAAGTALLIAAYVKFAGIIKGLPVLMYHKVAAKNPDYLTVTIQQLEKQFQHFKRKKYTTIFLSDLVEYAKHGKALPHKPLMLTFDDGYKNNYTYLYPLLRKYELKANIFLTASFIQTERDNLDQSEFLHVDDIRNMSDTIVQFGFHTYDHRSYADLSILQIDEDVKRSKQRIEELRISYEPCLAYAFGAYPKKDEVKKNEMFRVLMSNGIELAMCIGNRINKLPLKNKMLVKRIDVRGNESFLKFRISLFAGRKILFK